MFGFVVCAFVLLCVLLHLSFAFVFVRIFQWCLCWFFICLAACRFGVLFVGGLGFCCLVLCFMWGLVCVFGRGVLFSLVWVVTLHFLGFCCFCFVFVGLSVSSCCVVFLGCMGAVSLYLCWVLPRCFGALFVCVVLFVSIWGLCVFGGLVFDCL